MVEKNILNIMVSHHNLLEILFASFRDEVKTNSQRTERSLSELIWETKKHFFAEENAIFNFPPLKIIGVWEIVKHLKGEHVIMLEKLQNFLDNFEDIKDQDMDDFHNILENHRKIEEADLYPKLDEGMTASQKTQIILRLNEIPIKK